MNILQKFKETAFSVLPIMGIVLLLGLTVAKLDGLLLGRFVIGGILLIVGLTIFLLGVDMGIQPMGERCGAELTKKRNLPLLLICAFVIGFIVTAAEPDIQVFVDQVRGIYPFVHKSGLTFAIAGGVGLFITVGLLRTVMNFNVKITLLIAYVALFALTFFSPDSFVGIAFDSGGATTGPMTVPFIMALGLGVSSVRNKDSSGNSFGLTGIVSVGPVAAVILYAILMQQQINGFSPAAESAETAVAAATVTHGILYELFSPFGKIIASVLKESATSILPLLGLFILFQIFLLKLTKRQVIKILIGFAYSFVGLTIFLTGVNGGFSQAGAALGEVLGQKALSHAGWYVLLICTGLVLGAIIVCAEPAVWVLSEQVEQVSGGTIKRRFLLVFLSAGTAIAIGLALVKAVAGFNLKWILVPGYIIAMLLMIFSPSMYTAIAFDSGGVASGPLTSTFILSFTIGASSASGGSTNSFGVIALVAMMPLIAIQIMGIIVRIKTKKQEKLSSSTNGGSNV
jgi:hypothetical protein